MSESLVSDEQKIVIDNTEIEALIETGNSNLGPENTRKSKKNEHRVYSDFEILNAQMWRW